MKTLDSIIAAQAATYGMTVERYSRLCDNMAAIAGSVSEYDEVDKRLSAPAVLTPLPNPAAKGIRRASGLAREAVKGE